MKLITLVTTKNIKYSKKKSKTKLKTFIVQSKPGRKIIIWIGKPDIVSPSIFEVKNNEITISKPESVASILFIY